MKWAEGGFEGESGVGSLHCQRGNQMGWIEQWKYM